MLWGFPPSLERERPQRKTDRWQQSVRSVAQSCLPGWSTAASVILLFQQNCLLMRLRAKLFPKCVEIPQPTAISMRRGAGNWRIA